MVRSRNKVTVGEPVVGEYETLVLIFEVARAVCFNNGGIVQR